MGYGDFRPIRRRSRIIAIFIAVLGLLTTGIIVALGVNAATKALGLNCSDRRCLASNRNSMRTTASAAGGGAMMG